MNYHLLSRVAETPRKGAYFTRPPANEVVMTKPVYLVVSLAVITKTTVLVGYENPVYAT